MNVNINVDEQKSAVVSYKNNMTKMSNLDDKMQEKVWKNTKHT